MSSKSQFQLTLPLAFKLSEEIIRAVYQHNYNQLESRSPVYSLSDQQLKNVIDNFITVNTHSNEVFQFDYSKCFTSSNDSTEFQHSFTFPLDVERFNRG